jgi:hypothetical protein
MPLNAGDRHQPDSQQDRQRQQDHVVQVTEDRNEVRDQVDGRERVGGNGQRDRLGIPGGARVMGGEPEGVNIPPDRPRPVVDPSQHPFRSAWLPCPTPPGGFHKGSSATGVVGGM